VQASDAEGARETQDQRDNAEMFTVQQLRAMEQPSWNEGRLDDLNKRVDGGFERMDVEFRSVRGEMRRGFEKVDEEFKAVRSEMKEGFTRVDEEFKAVRSEMKEGFARVDEEFKAVRSEMKEGFTRVDEEFKAVRSEMGAGFDRLFWKLVSTGLSVAAAAFALAGFL
jgi:hypothetical protein